LSKGRLKHDKQQGRQQQATEAMDSLFQLFRKINIESTERYSKAALGRLKHDKREQRIPESVG
jgi:hypothetical protein